MVHALGGKCELQASLVHKGLPEQPGLQRETNIQTHGLMPTGGKADDDLSEVRWGQ